MRGILRIALTSFSFVPLQKWLNGIGILLLQFSVLPLLLLQRPGMMVAGPVLAILGAALIMLTPAFVGGVLLRYAASRPTMQLRPHGRLKLLLGATLAITLIALLATWPAALLHLLETQMHEAGVMGKSALFTVSLLTIFSVAWSAASLLWIAIFIVSRSQFMLAILPFGVIFIPRLIKAMGGSMPGAPALLTFGLTAWLLFALWYVSARTISRPAVATNAAPLDFRNPESAAGTLMAQLDRARGGVSRIAATRHYLLGAGSLATFAVMAGGFTLLLLAFLLLVASRRGFTEMLGITPMFLAMFVVTGAATSQFSMRRARSLWLRAGLSRSELFRLTERNALQVLAVMLGTGMAIVLPLYIATRPALTGSILLFTAVQIAFGLCMFYSEFSRTRAWTLLSVLQLVLAGILFFTQLMLTVPRRDASPVAAIVLLVAGLLLATLLRTHARQRWLTLDWHLTRPLAMMRRL